MTPPTTRVIFVPASCATAPLPSAASAGVASPLRNHIASANIPVTHTMRGITLRLTCSERDVFFMATTLLMLTVSRSTPTPAPACVAVMCTPFSDTASSGSFVNEAEAGAMLSRR